MHSLSHADSSTAFEILPSGNAIKVIGRGFWTVEELDAHFTELQDVLETSRRALGVALVLVDLRDAPVQTAAVTERLGWWTQNLYVQQDRVAIVVASSLLKSQMRRISMTAARELFLSSSAALTWLTAGLPNRAIDWAA